jgi:hypothetical protein
MSIPAYLIRVPEVYAKELQDLLEEELDRAVDQKRIEMLLHVLPNMASATGVPVERRNARLGEKPLPRSK